MANTSSHNKCIQELCCDAHPDSPLIYHGSNMICTECGLVVTDRIVIVGPKWRTSNKTLSVAQSCVVASENPQLSGVGGALSAMIVSGSDPASFNTCGTVEKQSSSETSNLAKEFSINAAHEISTMANRINLPKAIIDIANNLSKQVENNKYFKSRSKYAMGRAAACVYIACRQMQLFYTFEEICAISKVDKKVLLTCVKSVSSALAIPRASLTTGDPAAFISRFCAKLVLPTAVELAASHIASKAIEMEILTGRSPTTVAAAAIYMASNASALKISRKEVVNTVGISITTINQSLKLMKKYADQLFPEDFQSSI